MTVALNSEFKSDPLAFAQQHVLSVGGLPDTNFDKRRALRFDNQSPEEQESTIYDKVARAERVVFCDINPGAVGNGFAGSELITISAVVGAGTIPAFWLPYAQNRTRRIDLVDRRNADVIRRSGGEARWCFTSALNGCSVIVEGSPDAPTVYHLNAASHRVTEGPVTDQKTLLDRHARRGDMERRWRGTQEPKRIRNALHPPAVQPAALHAHDYLPNNYKTNPVEQNTEDTFYLNAAINATGVLAANVVDCQVNHTAFAFGFKSRGTGQWEFWVQQRARVRLTMNTGINHSSYVGRRLKKFWPTAGGQPGTVLVRGNHRYNTILVHPAM